MKAYAATNRQAAVGQKPAPARSRCSCHPPEGGSNQAIQARPRVGRSDDPLEREADQVAERVLAGAPAGPLHATPIQAQHKCTACAAEDERNEEETLQAKPKPRAPRASNAGKAADAVTAGGRPLPPQVRAYFEPRFARDFSAVRIHDNPRAHAAAQSVNAHAFTFGNAIAFSAGAYAPETHDGRRLLAHELSHVVQQTQPGRASKTVTPELTSPGERHEREADRAGARVASGQRAGAISAAPQSIARDGPTQARPAFENVWGFRVTRSMCDCEPDIQAAIDWARKASIYYQSCDRPEFTYAGEVEQCFNDTAYGPGVTPPPPGGTTSPSGEVIIAPSAGSGPCERVVQRGSRVHETFHARQADRIARSLGAAFFAEWTNLRGNPDRLDLLETRFPAEVEAFEDQWVDPSSWVRGEVESFAWERQFYHAVLQALSKLC